MIEKKLNLTFKQDCGWVMGESRCAVILMSPKLKTWRILSTIQFENLNSLRLCANKTLK